MPKIAPLPERFKIKYSFKNPAFDYAFPMVGVDVEFLKARRAEVRECFAQLAVRIGQINIVTSKGVAEIDTAAKLTRHYFYASKYIERQYLDLINPRVKVELTPEQEKTMYTGTLRQGK
jgi:hypothetical protein